MLLRSVSVGAVDEGGKSTQVQFDVGQWHSKIGLRKLAPSIAESIQEARHCLLQNMHWHHCTFVEINLQSGCISELVEQLPEFQHVLLLSTEDD